MDDIKNINSIESYNELFFMHCFYNSLFSVLNYHGKSIIPVLVNSIPLYKYDNNSEEISFSMDFISYLEVDEVLDKMGVEVITKNNNTTLVNDIIASINDGRPVIVSIDCYYMPIRPEFYLNKHWSHVILVYGYDDIKKNFNIIEQKFVDTLTYSKLELEYEHLINSYKGYLELEFDNSDKVSYCEYGLKNNYVESNSSMNEYSQIYLKNIYSGSKDIEQSLQLLKKFVEDFDMIFMDEQALKKYAKNLLNGLNAIINCKIVEKLKVQDLFEEADELIKLITETESSWNLIRNKMARYTFSSVYRQKDYVEIRSKLEGIYNAEVRYYDIYSKLYQKTTGK